MARAKKDKIRKVCNMKAYDYEWEIVLRFARILKHHDFDLCKEFVEKTEKKLHIDSKK